MKILHIVDTLCYGGRERNVVDICNSLIKKGEQVYILSLVNDNNPLACQLDKRVYYGVLDIAEKDIISLRMISSYGKVIRLLKEQIRNIQPDIIHTHSYLHRLLIINIAIKKSEVKSSKFHTVHTSGLYYSSNSIVSQVKRWIEKIAFKKVKPRLIAVSPVVQANNLKFYSTVTRGSKYIPNGIDLSEQPITKTREMLAIADKDIVVVYVARLSIGKNHKILIDAWELLTKNNDNLKLLLIGDGELKKDIEEVVKTKRLMGSIVFTGYTLDTKSYINMADIGVFPSEYEGFGIAMIEKMAQGIPVVASDIEICRYFIKHNINGLLFKTYSAQHLAEQLLYLINNGQLRQQLGQQAKIDVQKFALDTVIEQLSAYYQIK